LVLAVQQQLGLVEETAFKVIIPYSHQLLLRVAATVEVAVMLVALAGLLVEQETLTVR
jgi:hypothetical protein